VVVEVVEVVVVVVEGWAGRQACSEKGGRASTGRARVGVMCLVLLGPHM